MKGWCRLIASAAESPTRISRITAARQPSRPLPCRFLVERLELVFDQPPLRQRRHQEAGATTHGAGARLGMRGADPQRRPARRHRRRAQQAAFTL
jgi:hypothetical protein